MNQHDLMYWKVSAVWFLGIWGILFFFPTQEEKRDDRFRVFKVFCFMAGVISGLMILIGQIGGVEVIPIPVGDLGGN